MPTKVLGSQKSMLLNQVRAQASIDINQLGSLLNTYIDLKPEDFRGYIDDSLLEQLYELGRDPNEKGMWDQIVSAPVSTVEEIQNVQRLVSNYIQQYPQGPRG